VATSSTVKGGGGGGGGFVRDDVTRYDILGLELVSDKDVKLMVMAAPVTDVRSMRSSADLRGENDL
jgi:hypothetical protein